MSGCVSQSQSSEEMLSLLDEKTLSDLESESDRAEAERLFPSRSWINPVKPYLRTIRPSSVRSLLLRAGVALLPSFLQSRVGKERAKPDKLLPTAYMDGMRGLAALFVFFCHYAYTSFVITTGYGYGGPGENLNVLKLPIIRLLYSGPPMVCVFFVISGYALSLKPLKQMRGQSWELLYKTMSSSIFRRALRLFIPTTVSTFMVFIMLRMGVYEGTRTFSESQLLHNIHEHHPARLETFNEQLRDWLWHMFNFVCIFSWAPFAGSTGYDVHLWTIPVEFRASMMLFLATIALSRLRPWLRLTFLSTIILFVLRNDRWEMMLFFSGMFIAELDLIRQDSSPSKPLFPSIFENSPLPVLKKRIFGPTSWFILAALSLYLMSQPDEHSEDTPGWIWLCSLIPSWFSEKYRYWQTVGSITFMLAVTRLPILQRPFNTRIIQYFGKISYALYLVHGPVIHTIGYTIEPWAWGVTGSDSKSQHIAGFLLGALLNIPIVIWSADIFWRFVDAPSVKFARWFENACIAEEPQSWGKELPR
jgi:peptidoglycan/LPS O-acetylase OafA/YrhL